MIYRYNDTVPGDSVRFAKSILPMLGKITEFEIYGPEESVPDRYANVPELHITDGKNETINATYHMILRDNNGNELWLNGCSCGFSGDGPGAAIQILQLFGVRMDYFQVHQYDTLIQKNVEPVQDLNFVIFESRDRDPSERKKRLKIQLTFDRAHQKWKAKEAMKSLGFIQPLRNVIDLDQEETYYFRLPYSTENEGYEYATNNALILHPSISSITNEQLADLINDVCENCGGHVIRTYVY